MGINNESIIESLIKQFESHSELEEIFSRENTDHAVFAKCRYEHYRQSILPCLRLYLQTEEFQLINCYSQALISQGVSVSEAYDRAEVWYKTTRLES